MQRPRSKDKSQRAESAGLADTSLDRTLQDMTAISRLQGPLSANEGRHARNPNHSEAMSRSSSRMARAREFLAFAGAQGRRSQERPDIFSQAQTSDLMGAASPNLAMSLMLERAGQADARQNTSMGVSIIAGGEVIEHAEMGTRGLLQRAKHSMQRLKSAGARGSADPKGTGGLAIRPNPARAGRAGDGGQMSIKSSKSRETGQSHVQTKSGSRPHSSQRARAVQDHMRYSSLKPSGGLQVDCQ